MRRMMIEVSEAEYRRLEEYTADANADRGSCRWTVNSYAAATLLVTVQNDIRAAQRYLAEHLGPALLDVAESFFNEPASPSQELVTA